MALTDGVPLCDGDAIQLQLMASVLLFMVRDMNREYQRDNHEDD